MRTITVTLELPEGVELDTSAYTASHGTPAADAYGQWGFGPGTAAAPVMFTGDPDTAAVWITGTLAEAIDQLAEGAWALLP